MRQHLAPINEKNGKWKMNCHTLPKERWIYTSNQSGAENFECKLGGKKYTF